MTAAVFFMVSAIFVNFLAQKGFNSHTVTYNSAAYVCSLVLLVGISWYWQEHEFNRYLFFMGLLQAVFDTLGKVCLANALCKGPAGPITAVEILSTVMLTMYEALRLQ